MNPPSSGLGMVSAPALVNRAIRLGLAIAIFCSAVLAHSAVAQSFNQAIIFGDSNVDSGFYRALPNPGGGATFNALWPSAVANGAGKPTTSPGLMSSEVLAGHLGLSALPANQLGGTNYATSGAKNVTVNTAATGGFQAAIPTVNQIANYLAANGARANRNGIYLIDSGANDVAFALGQTGAGPFPANLAAYLVGSANGLAAAVANLQAAGARYIIVPDQPFSFPMGGGAGDAATRQAKLLMSQATWSSLAAAGVNFIPADINAVRVAIAASPSAFGFQFIDTAAGHVACTQPAGVNSAWALLCSSNPAAPSHLVTPDADQTRLFADDQHLSTAGQKIFGDYFYSLVVAPSEISLLAESAVKTRSSTILEVQDQIDVSRIRRGAAGWNVWITGNVSSLKVDNAVGFPGTLGTPFAGTVGIDRKWPSGLLVGAALTLGTAKPDFGLGGNFTQNEITGSVYLASQAGPIWGDVVGSFGTLSYDVNRIVPIGITLQKSNASTSGRNFSLAGEVGYDFTNGRLTHGPVGGLALQDIRIDGFTESGSFTSLAFDAQHRNSAVSAVGYRAVVDLGAFQPFAKVAWHHEWSSADRLITTSLTTIAAPSYTMSAVELGRNWASGSVGAAWTIGQGVTGLVALSSQAAQRSVATYGGRAGVNVAF